MSLSPNIQAMMQADLATATKDWSATLRFGRADVQATVSPVAKGDDAMEDGILPTADLELAVGMDAVQKVGMKIPRPRDIVQVDGERYWVQTVTQDPAALTLALKRGE